jgi:hypothetical protein
MIAGEHKQCQNALMHRGRAVVALLTGLCFAPSAAQACSIVADRDLSSAERVHMARQAIEQATAVVDAEVVRPYSDAQPALVRASRVLKGPSQEFFEVGERTSCDVRLDRPGERIRLVLVGGPDLYFVPIDAADYRDVDRLLGSDRRKDWPFVAGAAVPTSSN